MATLHGFSVLPTAAAGVVFQLSGESRSDRTQEVSGATIALKAGIKYVAVAIDRISDTR